MNEKQVEESKALFGAETVEMFFQAHKDALWMLENLGVGCRQPEMQKAFEAYRPKASGCL